MRYFSRSMLGVMCYDSTLAKYGKQVIYLFNAFQKIAVKIVPGDPYWYAKPKGEKEFRIHYTSDFASETLIKGDEITEKEYNEYS